MVLTAAQVENEFDLEFEVNAEQAAVLEAAVSEMERVDVRAQRLSKLLAEKSVEYNALVSTNCALTCHLTVNPLSTHCMALILHSMCLWFIHALASTHTWSFFDALIVCCRQHLGSRVDQPKHSHRNIDVSSTTTTGWEGVSYPRTMTHSRFPPMHSSSTQLYSTLKTMALSRRMRNTTVTIQITTI